MSPRAYPPGPTWASESRGKTLRAQVKTLLENPISRIRKRFESYGDIFFTQAFGTQMYVLRHPDHLHEVLVTKASSFAKRSKDLDVFLGDGLLTSDGELWRRQRRLIQPAFNRPRITAYASVMVEHTLRMLDGWTDGQVRDISRDMMELTLSVVSKGLLDHDVRDHNDAVASAMTVLQNTTGAFDLFPRWMPTPLHLKKSRASKELDRIIYPMIEARAGDPSKDDLISQLLRASDEKGTMSKKQLRDELVTLFLAGHETTALTMTWTFFLLSGYQDEERRLFEEVDRVLGGRTPGFEDLEALEQTRNIVQETMRLFPPLYILPRVAIEEVEIGGFSIAPGSELVLWVYFAQRDPRWFPDPDLFSPDRWKEGSSGVLHPHAYLPFGAGSRTCIGRHFAMAEAQLILALVAQRYRLRVEPGQRIVLNPRVTLGPQVPIRMRIERRTKQ